MKLFNLIKTIPLQQQRTFYQWLSVTAVLLGSLFLILFVVTGKVIYDYYVISFDYSRLCLQTNSFNDSVTCKHSSTLKAKTIAEQHYQLKKIVEEPGNPYKYFLEIFNMLSPEIKLEGIHFLTPDIVTVKAATGELALVDDFVRKLLGSTLFCQVHIESVNHRMIEKDKTALFEYTIRCITNV